MKKSFIVKFPIHQEFNHGLSWAQVNELSWVEVNLLSWKDLTVLVKRYLKYSIKYIKKEANNISFSAQKSLISTFIKKMSEAVQFTLKKVR